MIPLYKPYNSGKELEYLKKVIERQSYWVNGPEIVEVEKIVEESHNRKVLAFNSGTTALEALFESVGIEGKEVIVPAYTFIATANAALRSGGKIRFVDIEKETMGVSAEDLEKRINENTKAVVVVHYGGFPAKEIREIKRITEEKGLILIEDSAESLFAKLDNKYVGTFGKGGIFSFCGNKVLTSGEGGMLITEDEEIYNKAKLIRSHGRVEKGDYFRDPTAQIDYVIPGTNTRMSSITAAVLKAQLENKDIIIEKRRRIAKRYNELFESAGVEFLREDKNMFAVYQMYSILLKSSEERNRVIRNLSESKIGWKIYFPPLYKYSIYKGADKLRNTEEISSRILTLPIYPDMKEEDIELVVKKVVEAVK